MSSDSNVMIEAEGEVGDVMVRVEEEFWSSTPAYWELHEDPNVPRPLPVRPDFSSLLPEFNWPVAGFYVSYRHTDITAFEGYADYARSNPWRWTVARGIGIRTPAPEEGAPQRTTSPTPSGILSSR